MMKTQRIALSTGAPEVVAKYLPSNYVAVAIPGRSNSTLICGEDVAGWGLDTYVIPRLASGLYWATELVRIDQLSAFQ